MKEVLGARLILDRREVYYLGEPIKGKLFLIPTKDVNIEKVSYQLSLEVKGLTESRVFDFLNKNIIQDKMLQKDKEYAYPILLTNYSYETYQGANATCSIYFNISAKFHLQKKDQSFLSKINIFKDGITWEEKKYLTVKAKTNRYKLLSNAIALKTDTFSESALLAFQVFLGLITLAIVTSFQAYWPILLATGVLLPLFVYLFYLAFNKFILGSIKVRFKDIEKGVFQVILENEHRWKHIKKLSLNYRIVEEVVVDDQGSEIKTLSVTKYTSPIQQQEQPRDAVPIILNYPKQAIPTINLDKFRIYWLLELKISTTYGLSVKYNQAFSTKKTIVN